MKKLFALILAVMMMATLAVPAQAAEGAETVYLDIGDTVFGTVYCYAYERADSTNQAAAWPGLLMTQVAGSIYSVELDSSLDVIIFHNDSNGIQVEMARPTDGSNLYTYATDTWSVYAAGDSDASESGFDGKGEGSYNIDVNGSYTEGASVAEIVSVDIAWDAMSFTYTDSSLGTWDPKTHSYINGTEGGWSDNKPSITVTNHSNAAIAATFGFTAADGVPVNGSFYASADATSALSADARQFSLATAVGTTKENAPAGTLYFGVSGDAISEDKALGTITVKIEKDKWTWVSTEDELVAALYNGGFVKLMNDITTVYDWVEFWADAVLDLNGKTLNTNLGTTGIGLNYVIKNGTLNSSNPKYVSVDDTLTVIDCNINAGDSDQGAFQLTREGATLILAGTINLNNPIVLAPGNTVTCLAGTYNFDPTACVDTTAYTVADNGNGTWTVSAVAD